MRFGFALRLMGTAANASVLRESARRAEEAGLDALWVPDHIAIPPDDTEGSGGRYLEAERAMLRTPNDLRWKEGRMRRCLKSVFAPLVLLAAVACDPGVSRPGAWLSGEEVGPRVTDWAFTNAYEDCYLEAATWYVVPHSVTLWCAVHDGDLYVGSFSMSGGWEGYRTWENHLSRSGEGAARFGGKIYRGIWERVEDSGVLEAVEQSYAAKYGHTEIWKRGLAIYDPQPEWRFYRFRQGG